VSDGELIAEPLDLEDKREYKLNKILSIWHLYLVNWKKFFIFV
jgi:hypothetical protein